MESRIFVRKRIGEIGSRLESASRGSRGSRNDFLQRLSKLGIIAILAFVVVSGIAYLAPSADIIVIPETRKISGVLPILFDSTVDMATPERMSAVHVTKHFRGERTVPTTGSIDIGKKSRGYVMFTNRTGIDFPILTDHLIRGGDMMYYTVVADTVIPKASVSPEGDIVPGTIEVEVEAVDGGAQTALAAGRVVAVTTVPPERQDKIFGYVSRAIKGGSSNVVQSVAERDITTAIEQMIGEFKQTTHRELTERHGDERVVFDELLFASIIATSSIPGVFEPAREVSVSVEAEIVGVTAKRHDVESAILEAAKSSATLEPSERISSTLDYRIEQPIRTDEKGYGVKAVISYTVTVVPELPLEDIVGQLLGMPEHKARQLILSQKGVRDVRINQHWNFFSTFPSNPKKIHISVMY